MTSVGTLREAASARRGAGLWLVLVAAGLVLFGGCAPIPREPPPEVEASRTYEGQSRAAVFQGTLTALEASGLEVVGADDARGVITAVGRGLEDRGWADCPLSRITSRDNARRVRYARPLDREVELTATVGETAAGASLSLDSVFVERQLNSFINMPFNQRCRSTGVLERQLLEAVAS